MPGKQAVVTLHPLFLPDVLPFRSLTFASGLDTINVGRASKRENKKLTPAHHNAWFESRVMSRDHASLSVSLGRKVVYVRDNGSMHGTWVNDKKIPPGRDVAISTDDVLTFGAEVVNGSVTFAPLRARCECQWFDPREETASKPTLPQRPNSFCVPDDDDDVSDVYDSDSDSVWGADMVASADEDTADVAYDSVPVVGAAVASADDDAAGAVYGSACVEDEATDDDAADAVYDSVPVEDTAVASADNDAAGVAHDSVPMENTAVASAYDGAADVAYDSVPVEDKAVASTGDDAVGAVYGSACVEDTAVTSADNDAADVPHDSVPVEDTAVSSVDADNGGAGSDEEKHVTAPARSLKRKASEMESESFADENSPFTNIGLEKMNASQESFSQDAQPKARDVEAERLTPLLDEVAVRSERGPGDQPPQKRVKTAQKPLMGSFATHATTAIVGAMLGGLGTIVALASLPPEYFH